MLRSVLRGLLIGILILLLILMGLCAFLGWLVGRATADPLCSGQDLVILVDHSGSMARDLDPDGARWELVYRILKELQIVPYVSVHRRVALLAFGGFTDVLLPLADPAAFPEQSSIRSIVRRLPNMGWSDLDGALQFIETMSSSGRCMTVAIITDGVPQTAAHPDPEDHLPILTDHLKDLRQKGITVILILWAEPQVRSWEAFQKAYHHWVAMAEEGMIALVELQNPEDREKTVQAVIERLSSTSLPMIPKTMGPSPAPGGIFPPTPISTPSPPPPPATLSPSTAVISAPSGGPQWGWVALGFLAFISLLLLLIRLRRPHRPVLEGELVLILGPNSPVGRRYDLSALQRHEALLGEDLGRDFPKRAARLEAREDPLGRVRIWLIPLDPSRVTRNGQPVERELPLQDGMTWWIGPFHLRYENLKDRTSDWMGGKHDL